MILWIKAFHIIAMVAWFAALFYLPRLYVYHSQATDSTSIERFKIMERRLYYGIMTPSAFLTIFLGLWLASFNVVGYLGTAWFQYKIFLVALLFSYHLYSGYLRKLFEQDKNNRSTLYYRFYNEIPTVFLVAIVVLTVVKPNL